MRALHKEFVNMPMSVVVPFADDLHDNESSDAVLEIKTAVARQVVRPLRGKLLKAGIPGQKVEALLDAKVLFLTKPKDYKARAAKLISEAGFVNGTVETMLSALETW